ncbi:MAG: hypothetical protein H6558_06485 [Lewinellaceae bacterium]|nr:hypothetical protein [Lewinellaceae bacterium]MCB9287137.1 hypothetical protein [Lewinellaceae bacterium]
MMTQQAPLFQFLRRAPQQYLKEILSLYGPPVQSFTIDPEKQSQLRGARGTLLSIPPYAMVGLSGNPAKGRVELQLKEAFTPGEMIMAGRPTTSEDRLMESGGQLMIRASHKGLPLRLARPVEVGIPVHRGLRNASPMRLFTGSTSTFQAYSAGNDFDWRMVSEKAVRISKIKGRKYYDFQLDEFNWAGCEYFVARKASRCMVTARPVGAVNRFDSLMGYLVFKDIRAVARMYPGKHNCTAVNIPERLSASAHLIGVRKGILYYGSGQVWRASEKLVDVRMRPVMEKELAGILREI